ncbi:hypothetical protein ACOME3_010533 [Neoechinorhynchus agilis]
MAANGNDVSSPSSIEASKGDRVKVIDCLGIAHEGYMIERFQDVVILDASTVHEGPSLLYFNTDNVQSVRTIVARDGIAMDDVSSNDTMSVFGWTPTNIDLPELERFRQKEIKRIALLRSMETAGVSDKGLQAFSALAKLFGSEIVRWEADGEIVVNDIVRVGTPYTSENCVCYTDDKQRTCNMSKDTLNRVKMILQRSMDT